MPIIKYTSIKCNQNFTNDLQLAGFASSVNVTLGLPIVRTSVDHGTAFDIGSVISRNLILTP
jgi:hypothetical protein